MEAEYGETIGRVVGGTVRWVSSFWGSPAAPVVNEAEMAQLTSGPIGELSTPQDPLLYDEELSFEDSIIEQSRMEGEMRWTRGTPTQETEMADLNPLQRQGVQLGEVEQKVDNILEAPPEDIDPEVTEFLEQEFGISNAPEVGTAEFEETLVRREIQLAEDGFQSVARLANSAEELLEGGGGVVDLAGAELAADVMTWGAMGVELLASLGVMAVFVGIVEFGKWILRDIDERRKEALELAGFTSLNYGHFTDGPSEDYPGYGTAAFAILGGQYGITMNCKVTAYFEEDNDFWFVEYRDLYSYLRRDVKIHKTRVALEWGPHTKVRDLTKEQLKRFRPTSNYKRDNKSSTWATSKYLGRYPLYPLGTPVLSIKSGRTGKIVYTYDHNGTDGPDETGVWNTKNGDKYGVRLDPLPGQEKVHRRNPVLWHVIDELLVENPMNSQWDRVAGKFQEIYERGKTWISPSAEAAEKEADKWSAMIETLVKEAEDLSSELNDKKTFEKIMLKKYDGSPEVLETDEQFVGRLQNDIAELRKAIKERDDQFSATKKEFDLDFSTAGFREDWTTGATEIKPNWPVPQGWSFKDDIYTSPDGLEFEDLHNLKEPAGESIPFNFKLSEYARYLINKKNQPPATLDWDPRFSRETGGMNDKRVLYPDRVKGLKDWYKQLGRPDSNWVDPKDRDQERIDRWQKQYDERLQVSREDQKKIQEQHATSASAFNQFLKETQEETQKDTQTAEKTKDEHRRLVNQSVEEASEPDMPVQPAKKAKDESNNLLWIGGLLVAFYILSA